MSNTQRDHGPIVVGGEPRIDFLPAETKKRKANRRSRRSLVALVIMVLIVCILGGYGATTFAATSQAALDAERATTQDLLKQEAAFTELRGLQTALQTEKDARVVVTATQILWDAQLDELLANMPVGTGIIGVVVDGMSTSDGQPLPTGIFEKPRVATLTLTFSVPAPVLADTILVGLGKQKDYADATIVSVDFDDAKGYWVVIAKMSLTADAFQRSFPPDAPDGAAPDEEVTPTPEPTPTDSATPTASPTPGTEG